MKELSERTGHDFLAGAFPRGYDPTAPRPPRPRTAMDRVNDCLRAAREMIEQNEALRAGTAEPAPSPIALAAKPIAAPEPSTTPVAAVLAAPPVKTEWLVRTFAGSGPFMGVG
jgi:hypothetical protein